jgi:hypothetical protein
MIRAGVAGQLAEESFGSLGELDPPMARRITLLLRTIPVVKARRIHGAVITSNGETCMPGRLIPRTSASRGPSGNASPGCAGFLDGPVLQLVLSSISGGLVNPQ